MNKMKFIRIFLLVLIVIGLGLLVAQKLWVPKVVDMIMKGEREEQIFTVSKDKNLPNNSTVSPAQVSSNKKIGCFLKPYTGTIPFSSLEYYSPEHEDVRAGVFCNFIINAKLPIFTFHFLGQEDNTLGKIEVSKGDSEKVIQTIDNNMEYGMTLTKSRDILEPVDVNFDGYLDLAIVTSCGVTGNCSYNIYLYNPAMNQFIKNSFLSSLDAFKPSGIDSAKKQITASWNSGYANREENIYQYQDGRYTLIQRDVSRLSNEDQTITREVYKLENGSMKLVSSTTTPNNF